MKERPILFSGPMIRAILEGRKSQTRRIVSTGGALEGYYKFEDIRRDPVRACFQLIRRAPKGMLWVPYGGVNSRYGDVGDRLWVRETWQQFPKNPVSGEERKTLYAADFGDWAYNVDSDLKPWRPSIFMPRALSRITLEITEVRVERLQEITSSDCVAEGVATLFKGSDLYRNNLVVGKSGTHVPQEIFQQGWNKLNAKRGFGWDTNPWVWVLGFKQAPTATLGRVKA